MAATIAELGERALRRLGVVVVAAADRPALAVTVPVATIATGALIELGIISAEESPQPLDQALAVSKVGALHDGLVAQGAIGWTNSAIPQAVSEDYIKLAALHLASAFGKTRDAAALPVLEARVRHVAVVMAAPDLAARAVQGVHDDLAARGRVRWSSFDIPSAVADAYVVLAASAIAPDFAAKTDPRDDLAAHQALARYIAMPSDGVPVAVEYF